MKHKFLTLAAVAAFASTLLFSCQNAEEPMPTVGQTENLDGTEYTITVDVPDEMRTRGQINETGLWENSPLQITNLAYVMYYDGEVREKKTIQRNNNNTPFTINVRLGDKEDPTKIWYFFFASNATTKLFFDTPAEQDKNVYINTTEKTIETYPIALSGNVNSQNNLIDKDIDLFYGYYQFATTNDKTNRNPSFTLKRCLAEFHILTDDFQPTESDLYKDYFYGIWTQVGFGDEQITQDNKTRQKLFPSKLNFETGEIVGYSSFKYENQTYFLNKLSNTYNKRTMFKDRTMDYLGYFLTLAPATKSAMEKEENTLNKLNIVVNRIPKENGSFTDIIESQTKYISVPLPEEGIQANHKYVIYDKARSEGGTGFIDGYFDYVISVDHDDVWVDSYDESAVDRLD